MDPVYVTGHLNPDTDSIVSAIAYSALRNALGDRQYISACLGNISDETQAVLDFFDVAPPTLITNVRTQVHDLQFDIKPTLGRNVTVNKAWEMLKSSGRGSIPVVDADGHLFGMLTSGDIASYVMDFVYENEKESIPTCELSELLSKPIESICCKDEIYHFHLTDYIDDVKDVVLRTRFRSYPVLDEKDVVVGCIGRYHLIRPNRKKVVLVDHNELSQSVPGLKQYHTGCRSET